MSDQAGKGTETKKTRRKLIILATLLSLAIFCFDLTIQLGFAGGVYYVVLVLLALFFPQAGLAFLMAVAGSLLTVLGYFFSPPGGVFWIVLLNRVLALIVIWITAILIHRYQSANKASKIAEEALRQSEEMLRTVTETALDAISNSKYGLSGKPGSQYVGLN